MKRFNNLYQEIISIDNLNLADKKARRGKLRQRSVLDHDKNREAHILFLHNQLKDNSYRTSNYTTFKIKEPKERLIYRLPYFPDRILHHGIMNVLAPIFISTFTADTYSCIKGRGIHSASNKLKIALQKSGTKYCLKIDIKKFYPSINHDVLKILIRRKFKDNKLLGLLDEIIDSSEGLPIGNYLSQFLANFYLTYFDHWIKENKNVKYYFRYADDMIFLSDSKEFLHQLLLDIKTYLHKNLKLTVKENYQVFLVESRGIDILGYVFRKKYTRIRKRTKKNFARSLRKKSNIQSVASYTGLLKHGNCINLTNKLLHAKRA